jgi:hypothetical protein
MTTCDAATKWLPFTISVSSCCTYLAAMKVVGSGRFAALREGFVPVSPGRTRSPVEAGTVRPNTKINRLIPVLIQFLGPTRARYMTLHYKQRAFRDSCFGA